ncbi:hypothetical protein BT96DRAFT_980990 [Gymnopus androsaceus JB14]|uniref:Uncharacterized protein n=1 Tax=Gymnopus androsaceus JB14 TaxID=1447944 RepID=A0A6A4GS18_9AGAR|nr:hypothetical protein BT96DRAFT_980990 [Gymnopus androsaceus JB14]
MAPRSAPIISPRAVTRSHTHLHPPYRTTEKLQRGLSAAQSLKYNPRNHENNWHAVWGLVLADLTEYYTNLLPQLQYAQWRAKEGVYDSMTHANVTVPSDNMSDEDALSEANSDEERGTAKTALNATVDDDDEDDDEPVLNSPSRLAATTRTLRARLLRGGDDIDDDAPETPSLPAGRNLNVEALLASTSSNKTVIAPMDDDYPDLAILHTIAILLKKPRGKQITKNSIRYSKRCGFQTVHQCPALLGEMKTNVSRTKEIEFLINGEVENNDAAIRQKLLIAKLQMAKYLYTFFKRYPKLEEVITLVTAGPYWQCILFKKNDLPKWDKNRDRFEGVRQVRVAHEIAYLKLFGKKFYELGSDESDKALTRIRDNYLHQLSTEN